MTEIKGQYLYNLKTGQTIGRNKDDVKTSEDKNQYSVNGVKHNWETYQLLNDISNVIDYDYGTVEDLRLSQIVQLFAQGDMTVDELQIGLKSKKIADINITENDGTTTVTFTYEGKKYTLKCSTDAAKSQIDDVKDDATKNVTIEGGTTTPTTPDSRALSQDEFEAKKNNSRYYGYDGEKKDVSINNTVDIIYPASNQPDMVYGASLPMLDQEPCAYEIDKSDVYRDETDWAASYSYLADITTAILDKLGVKYENRYDSTLVIFDLSKEQKEYVNSHPGDFYGIKFNLDDTGLYLGSYYDLYCYSKMGVSAEETYWSQVDKFSKSLQQTQGANMMTTPECNGDTVTFTDDSIEMIKEMLMKGRGCDNEHHAYNKNEYGFVQMLGLNQNSSEEEIRQKIADFCYKAGSTDGKTILVEDYYNALAEAKVGISGGSLSNLDLEIPLTYDEISRNINNALYLKIEECERLGIDISDLGLTKPSHLIKVNASEAFNETGLMNGGVDDERYSNKYYNDDVTKPEDPWIDVPEDYKSADGDTSGVGYFVCQLKEKYPDIYAKFADIFPEYGNGHGQSRTISVCITNTRYSDNQEFRQLLMNAAGVSQSDIDNIMMMNSEAQKINEKVATALGGVVDGPYVASDIEFDVIDLMNYLLGKNDTGTNYFYASGIVNHTAVTDNKTKTSGIDTNKSVYMMKPEAYAKDYLEQLKEKYPDIYEEYKDTLTALTSDEYFLKTGNIDISFGNSDNELTNVLMKVLNVSKQDLYDASNTSTDTYFVSKEVLYKINDKFQNILGATPQGSDYASKVTISFVKLMNYLLGENGTGTNYFYSSGKLEDSESYSRPTGSGISVDRLGKNTNAQIKAYTQDYMEQLKTKYPEIYAQYKDTLESLAQENIDNSGNGIIIDNKLHGDLLEVIAKVAGVSVKDFDSSSNFDDLWRALKQMGCHGLGFNDYRSMSHNPFYPDQSYMISFDFINVINYLLGDNVNGINYFTSSGEAAQLGSNGSTNTNKNTEDELDKQVREIMRFDGNIQDLDEAGQTHFKNLKAMLAQGAVETDASIEVVSDYDLLKVASKEGEFDKSELSQEIRSYIKELIDPIYLKYYGSRNGDDFVYFKRDYDYDSTGSILYTWKSEKDKQAYVKEVEAVIQKTLEKYSDDLTSISFDGWRVTITTKDDSTYSGAEVIEGVTMVEGGRISFIDDKELAFETPRVYTNPPEILEKNYPEKAPAFHDDIYNFQYEDIDLYKTPWDGVLVDLDGYVFLYDIEKERYVRWTNNVDATALANGDKSALQDFGCFGAFQTGGEEFLIARLVLCNMYGYNLTTASNIFEKDGKYYQYDTRKGAAPSSSEPFATSSAEGFISALTEVEFVGTTTPETKNVTPATQQAPKAVEQPEVVENPVQQSPLISTPETQDEVPEQPVQQTPLISTPETQDEVPEQPVTPVTEEKEVNTDEKEVNTKEEVIAKSEDVLSEMQAAAEKLNLTAAKTTGTYYQFSAQGSYLHVWNPKTKKFKAFSINTRNADGTINQEFTQAGKAVNRTETNVYYEALLEAYKNGYNFTANYPWVCEKDGVYYEYDKEAGCFKKRAD